MAAAEYFSNAPMTQSSYQPPPPRPQQATYSPNPAPHTSYIQTQGAPPPYQEQRPGFYSAPIPIEPPQRHSFSGQHRPSFPSPPNSWSQPPQAYSQQPSPSNMPMQSRPPQSYGTSPANGYGAQPQNPQYLSPHAQPPANPNASQLSLENDGYTSDPESRRRKHKHKSRRDSRESRSGKPNSRSKNADAFLGAAGGGLIGDLIFPGLGTVGGAALGWLGGRDYGNHRKEREEKRHREQREWEDKFRPNHHHHHHHHHHNNNRSRSRDRKSRGSSTDIGEIDHRDSHGRRHGHH